MTASSLDSGFREKVQARHDQAIAQIDSIIDIAIGLTRTQSSRGDDPVGFMDVQKMLEMAVTIYAANCGPLETSAAAWLMLKAISKTLPHAQR